MELSYEPKPTRPVSHDELIRFVKAADEAAEGSLDTCHALTFNSDHPTGAGQQNPGAD